MVNHKKLLKKLVLEKLINLRKITVYLQDWVMDPLKVKDVINKVDPKNLRIKDFIRIKIGE